MGDSDAPRYLRSNVVIEPLVDRFYAWLHTVAPVQAAMKVQRFGKIAPALSAASSGNRIRPEEIAERLSIHDAARVSRPGCVSEL